MWRTFANHVDEREGGGGWKNRQADRQTDSQSVSAAISVCSKQPFSTDAISMGGGGDRIEN